MRAKGEAGAGTGRTHKSLGVRRLRAGRARAKVGGKAAVRLQSFVEQRGLGGVGGGGRQARAPSPRTVQARPGADPEADWVYQQMLAAPATSPGVAIEAHAPVWRFLGPRWIPEGQTYGEGPGSSPSVAGRVTAIGVDPSDGSHLLVGSGGGGVWETRNRGRTWEPRTDDQPSLGIGALAFDPSDPAKVYAGTGEGNSNLLPGQGLLTSADGGTSWILNKTAEVDNTLFYRLIVDPTDGDRLFAATADGILVSTDGAETWTASKEIPTWDLSLGVAAGASIEVLAATTGGLYRSGDAGSKWKRLHLPWGPERFDDPFGRMAVAHAPSDPGIAYAFATNWGSVWLWRREQAGGRFSRIELPPRGLRGDGTSQAWYDWCLAVAPDDPDTVFLGAIELFRGRPSSRGGWSWKNIASRRKGDSIHPDQHCVVFDPSDPNVLYAGNDGGIYRSPDRGDSWKSLNKGLAIAEIEYLAQHPRWRTWMIAGTQDNGTLRHRGEGIWDQIAEGDGGDCAVNAASPDTCYHSFYYMAIERSRSAGERWTDITPEVPLDYRVAWYPPLEANGTTVACAGETVLVSDDEGRKWKEIPLPAGELASAMTFASDARILVGREDGHVFSIDRLDGGWDVPEPLSRPREAFLSDLLVQSRSGRYWATYSTVRGPHVFRSVNGGWTWEDMSSGFDDIPVSAIEADPRSEDRLWLATDRGVFQTMDGGGSWSEFGRGLPRALAVDLVFHAKLRLLRVGTKSRGAWEIEIT